MSFIILGRKVGMTQVFDENNRLLPVTVLELGPCSVTQVKTADKDGYEAVQVGFGSGGTMNKARRGHLGKAKVEKAQFLREFRLQGDETYAPGDKLTVEKFSPGDRVDVIGVTKGKGFQGVMKRYNFAGGPASHGSMTHRRGGSYGNSQDPGRVMKGKKMPGHMGHVRRTVQNLTVVRVDPDRNLLLVRGSLPGPNGGVVTLRPSKKQRRSA